MVTYDDALAATVTNDDALVATVTDDDVQGATVTMESVVYAMAMVTLVAQPASVASSLAHHIDQLAPARDSVDGHAVQLATVIDDDE